jgi:formyl-CoA transferase
MMNGGRPHLPLGQQDASLPQALAGVRVIDFTRFVAGPFATQILADLGAEVIKIENPVGGDDTRALDPKSALGGESGFFISVNRGKQSVAIDLKSEAGREVVLDLMDSADIVVENFTGAVMRKLKLDYPSVRERFPHLIYCSVSAYGRSGSNADAAGLDSPLSAAAGVMALNADSGNPPVMGTVTYTDISTALNAAIGILAALQARTRTGKGQHVDVAMFDSALANLSFKGFEFLTSGKEPVLNQRQGFQPRGYFDTADGAIVLTCGNDKMFKALCTQVVNRPDWLDDERYATMAKRVHHGAAFLELIRPIFKTQSSAVWVERCGKAGIPCGPVRTPGEALLSDEAAERQLVFDIPHPTAGQVPVIAQPFRLSETPCQYHAPPLLGQHTRQALKAITGYDDARIDALAAAGAVGVGVDQPKRETL